MKLFYPEFHYQPTYRKHLFPLLKPITKENSDLNSDKATLFSESFPGFYMTSNLLEADRVLLPMSWNYYIKTGTKHEALNIIQLAEEAKKTVWMVLLGDFGLPIPTFEHVIVFRPSGYRSQLPKYHKGMPVFITDPLQYRFSEASIFFPVYEEKPQIGFCGMASSSLLLASKQLLKIALENIAYYLGVFKYSPEALLAAAYLRYRCLKNLEAHSAVQTRFIMNQKYRAGARTKESRNESTQKYFKNMAASQYVLCVRGRGNFSVRFYETLAMGRIPIYLDTDGLLPLTDIIDWKQHVVWIDWHERHHIAEKVVAFHKRLDATSIQALSHANRELWKTHLQTGIFFRNC